MKLKEEKKLPDGYELIELTVCADCDMYIEDEKVSSCPHCGSWYFWGVSVKTKQFLVKK